MAEPERFLQELISTAEGAAFFTEGQGVATIAGHTLPLGTMRTHLPQAQISNVKGLRKALEAARPGEDLTVDVSLEAIGDKTLRMSLVPG